MLSSKASKSSPISARLALITGASSGIGKALAERFAAMKIPLLLVARREDNLKAIQAELGNYAPVEIRPLDLAVPEQRAQLTQLIQARAPDLVINAAGFGYYGSAWDHDTQESLEMVELNVSALVEITIEAARALRERKEKGIILNVASAAAFFSYPTFAVYAATKGFVKQFSEALDAETMAYGIRVLCACPGQFDSEFRLRASKGHSPNPSREAMTLDEAADHVMWQIKKQKRTYIFNWRYRVLAGIIRILPQSFADRLLMQSLKGRTPDSTQSKDSRG